MNKARRAKIEDACDLIAKAREILEQVKEEEDDAFCNLPDSFQESERGEQMQEYIYNLEDVCSNLEEAEETAYEIVEA